jgi:hypothetical protein
MGHVLNCGGGVGGKARGGGGGGIAGSQSIRNSKSRRHCDVPVETASQDVIANYRRTYCNGCRGWRHVYAVAGVFFEVSEKSPKAFSRTEVQQKKRREDKARQGKAR